MSLHDLPEDWKRWYKDPNSVVTLDDIAKVEATMTQALHAAPETLFWYWIAERHAIYLRRKAGEPKPWTTDPILRDYKFTNPFRQNDRGTVWLTEHFLEPHRDDDLGLLAFNIAWYRMFNWWGTGELLGWRDNWHSAAMATILEEAMRQGKQVFTGSHIVYSRPGMSKIDCIVDVCSELYHLCLAGGAFTTVCAEENSLEAVYELLKTVDCVGNFMAYEMVTDMRHTRLLEGASDIMTWANMGPGAKRGLGRLGLPCANQTQGNASMQQLLSHAPFGYVGALGVGGIIDLDKLPPFEMRDIEHSLCEFDKYCRVKFGEGEPRSKFDGRG